MPRKIHLALHPYGVGGPGQHGLWKDTRIAKNASIDINYYIAQAQAAEHALFDALFIVDSQFINATYPAHYLNRLEPLTLLSAVATHTRHIGLVGTASSTYNSPFNLARRFASLDHISGGRAGWNVVTSFDTGTAKNYGLDEHLDYATRYGRALEFVHVARGLWDSYEDDAFPADVERNVFLDPAKAARPEPRGGALQRRGPAQHLPLAPGPARHLPGRCLRRRPRPGRPGRRGHLRAGWSTATGPGLLRRHQEAHRLLRPRPRAHQDLHPRRPDRRRHRRGRPAP